MKRITILEETTVNPITLMGKRAGVCWGSDVTDSNKNYQRGLNCIMSGHDRVMEYVNIEMIIDGYSSRVIREWYTHLGGSPTRLQASTRYINYGEFRFTIPKSINKDEDVLNLYEKFMEDVNNLYKNLIENHKIPIEDAALILPLGMTTKIVDKRNLRNLIDMSNQRMCNRTNWEFRELLIDICDNLRSISLEWEYLIDNYFVPKCKVVGYCLENNSCGMLKKHM